MSKNKTLQLSALAFIVQPAAISLYISDKFYDILSSYLSDRKQIVVVDGQKSDILDVQGWGHCFL